MDPEMAPVMKLGGKKEYFKRAIISMLSMFKDWK